MARSPFAESPSNPSLNDTAHTGDAHERYHHLYALPHFNLAHIFAISNNRRRQGHLNAILAPNVKYISHWSGVRYGNRYAVILHFRYVYRRAISLNSIYYSQVVETPEHTAGVLVAWNGPACVPNLVTFEESNGVATRVLVSTKYDPGALQRFGFFPPDY